MPEKYFPKELLHKWSFGSICPNYETSKVLPHIFFLCYFPNGTIAFQIISRPKLKKQVSQSFNSGHFSDNFQSHRAPTRPRWWGIIIHILRSSNLTSTHSDSASRSFVSLRPLAGSRSADRRRAIDVMRWDCPPDAPNFDAPLTFPEVSKASAHSHKSRTDAPKNVSYSIREALIWYLELFDPSLKNVELVR
jgi:hypothetical protein